MKGRGEIDPFLPEKATHKKPSLVRVKYTFFVLQYHSCFSVTLEADGVLFFLMVSFLHFV